ncbi:hypothetical protein CTA2_1023 [Colletotrichum tanaceti]|nr:hypothetical protein CTA2_1023 [Colletotrichum tanaceti]
MRCRVALFLQSEQSRGPSSGAAVQVPLAALRHLPGRPLVQGVDARPGPRDPRARRGLAQARGRLGPRRQRRPRPPHPRPGRHWRGRLGRHDGGQRPQPVRRHQGLSPRHARPGVGAGRPHREHREPRRRHQRLPLRCHQGRPQLNGPQPGHLFGARGRHRQHCSTCDDWRNWHDCNAQVDYVG